MATILRRRVLALGMGPLLAAVILTGCTSETPRQAAPSSSGVPAPTGAKESKPIVIGMGALGATLDPHVCTSTLCYTSYYAIFDALTAIDTKGTVGPSLATSWKTLDDKTWEFKLRTDVKFQNGESFNAQTVKFSIDRLLTRDSKLSAATRIPLVQEVKVVDDSTVQFITRQPDPLLPGRLSVIFVIPPKYFQEVGAEKFASQAVGTGPWKVEQFDREQKLVLSAWQGSWRGVPKTSKITLVSLPEDSARVAALRSGDVDIIQNVPADQITQLQAGGYQVTSAMLGRIHLANLATTRGTPLDNKLVRQAMNYAVDKEAILKGIMQGQGQLAEGQMIGPNGVGYNPEVKPFPYDVNKAKELLAQAGYPGGFSIAMESSSGAYVNDKATSEAVVGYLSKVGIKVDLKFAEQASYIDRLLKGQLAPMSFMAWNYFPVMDADFTYNWFLSSNPANLYKNPEFDRLFNESRVTMDPEKRKRQLDQLAVLTHDDPPGLYLFYAPDIAGVSKSTSGFTPRSDTVFWLDNLTKQ